MEEGLFGSLKWVGAGLMEKVTSEQHLEEVREPVACRGRCPRERVRCPQ